MGTLYYGDNLDILKRYVADASVDLVYLDPPFNSAQTYNAFFQEKDGTAAASQVKAFEDTWHWNTDSVAAYNAITEQPGKVSEVMQAFRTFLGGNDMMAYLAMMAPRLVELRRVLKPTGSLYLHCDTTASHYLKLLLDAVLGKENFRNEIIWKRTTAKGLASRSLPSNHDVIFRYAARNDSEEVWNRPFDAYNAEDLDEKTAKKYCYRDLDGRRYTLGDLNNPNADRPNLAYEFLGHNSIIQTRTDRIWPTSFSAIIRFGVGQRRGWKPHTRRASSSSPVLGQCHESNATWMSGRAGRSTTCGTTSHPSTPKPRNASAIPRRNPSPSSGASSP